MIDNPTVNPDDQYETEHSEERTLVPIIRHYSLDDLDGQPLPTAIYNANGVAVAQAGSTVSKKRLQAAYIYIDADKVKGDYSNQPNDKDLLSDSYEEESTEQITERLGKLPFTPKASTEANIRSHVSKTHNIFKKKIIDGVIHLDSKDNETVSRGIVQNIDSLLETPKESSDYMDTVSALRNKDNYLTFSHSCGVAFYTMAIAKKLKMLKEDMAEKKRVGRWLTVKTTKHPVMVGAVPFSEQLLQYIDMQIMAIRVRYQAADAAILEERVHDIMHDYYSIDFSRSYPSMQIDYSDQNLQYLTMAALNHDIGKVCIPNHILNKPAKLTKEEFDVIKGHPSLGVSKLRESGVNLPRVFGYILGHHILSNEMGYPQTKHRPFPESKIIAISDIYDALRSPRQYKKPVNQAETIEHLTDLYRKGAFDKPLFVAALHTFEEFNHDLVKKRYQKVDDEK